MTKRDCGFSTIELMVVVLIIGIVLAFAIPQATTGLRDYRLHSDAGKIASQLNVTRLRAASQYHPYRLVINIAAGTYWMEQLCGNTLATTDANCTSAYQPYTTPVLEGGTQVVGTNDSYVSCRAGLPGVSAYPGSITTDPSPCPDPLYIYFNTRGSPVDNSGNPLTAGGDVLYLTNTNQKDLGAGVLTMADAVTVSIGGGVNTWQWSKAGKTWSSR